MYIPPQQGKDESILKCPHLLKNEIYVDLFARADACYLKKGENRESRKCIGKPNCDTYRDIFLQEIKKYYLGLSSKDQEKFKSDVLTKLGIPIPQ